MRRTPGLRLVARRAVADLPLVALYLVIVLVTAALAVAAPRLVFHAGEDGLRYTLEHQSKRTDVVAAIELPDAHYSVGLIDLALASDVQDTATALHSRLSETLAPVLTEPVATVTTRTLDMPYREGPPASLRLHYVWAEGASGVTWLTGSAPGVEKLSPNDDGSGPVEVAFSEAVAQALGVEAGQQLTLKQPDNSVYTIVITGTFRADDPADPVWAQAPGLLDPVISPQDGSARMSAGALLGDQSLPVIRMQLPEFAISASYTFALKPASMRVADIAPVTAALGALRSQPANLSISVGPTVAVASELDGVLDEYAAQWRAAQSQAAVVGAAVGVVSALALLVCGGLLAARRRGVHELEMARGATAAAMLSRVGLESLLVTVVGAAAGALLANALVAEGGGSPALVIPSAIVAVLASPVAVFAAVTMAGRSQRPAANRSDRRRARNVQRGRRATFEAAVVLLAIAASVAARSRGVTSSGTTSIDPLVITAPILLALAATIVVVRLMPAALTWIRRAAAHLRGETWLVGAARAHAARFGGPAVTALTLSLGMIMVCGSLLNTVQTSQSSAALARTGAHVVVHADDASLRAAGDEIAGHDGIDNVVLGRIEDGTQVRIDGTVSTATVVMVDGAAFAAQRSALGLPGLDATLVADSASPQAFVRSDDIDPTVAGFEVFWADAFVPVSVAQRIASFPDIAAPLIVIDADQWAQSTGADVAWNTMWVTGRTADAAVATASQLDDATVTSSAAYVESLRDSPLTQALSALLAAGVWLFALFGALVLVLWVLASSSERSRTLSALRTLGLSRRGALRISIVELLPSVAAALLAATGIGVAIPFVLGPSLGLESLTGGSQPEVAWSTDALVIAIAVATAALVLTILVESALRRRTRLGQVLRVGAS